MLEIKPSQDPELEIRCSLVPLEHGAQYEAISWIRTPNGVGIAKTSCADIRINRRLRMLQSSKRLRHLLRSLRNKHSSRLVFIDLICVPDNIYEVTRYVNALPYTYFCAQKITVYLDNIQDSDLTCKSIQALADLKRTGVELLDSSMRRECFPSLTSIRKRFLARLRILLSQRMVDLVCRIAAYIIVSRCTNSCRR